MPGIEISKKNHERLIALRDEQGYRSFNEVLDNLLPEGTVSSMDCETEKPAFQLLDSESNLKVNVLWSDLHKANVGDEWCSNSESAKVLFKDDDGLLIRFIFNEVESNGVFLNYFHFI
jgi:hypothetical protein